MSSLMFFKNIVPLNRETHKNLRFHNPDGTCRFAAKSTFVPVAGNEFFQASRDYPILFSGNDDEVGPVVLLGLRADHNLFVEDNGRWTGGFYLPAFVRQYPFILAHSDENKEQLTICFDQNYSGLNEDEGTRLFTEEGEDSQFLKDSINFLQLMHSSMRATRNFVKKLEKLDLLRRRDLQLKDPQKGNYTVRDFKVVDEERLAALTDKQFLSLRKDGYLPWIYAHLISLGNTAHLHGRL